jgi:sigma-E factor negative regulatory protein RseA
VNEDERASQLSTMFDGELPAAECELLSRRLARDEQLRATWSRYAVIGAALRAEPLAQVRPDFARRVSAAIAAPAAGSSRRLGALRSAALGTAIAAGVAGVAILLLRQDIPVQDQVVAMAATGGNGTTAAGPAPVTVAASMPARFGVAGLRGNVSGATNASREGFSYVVPPAGGDSNLAVPATLADYVVAHSEVSSPLARGSLLSVLVSNEAVQPAPDSMLSDARP